MFEEYDLNSIYEYDEIVGLTYKLFLKQWQCSGGMYDVRTKKETFKGIYDISQRFSFLTVTALGELWFRYISDLFEEFKLRGLCMDGKTKQFVIDYLVQINLIDSKCDSEEAQYVKRIQ